MATAGTGVGPHKITLAQLCKSATSNTCTTSRLIYLLLGAVGVSGVLVGQNSLRYNKFYHSMGRAGFLEGVINQQYFPSP